MDQVVIYNQFYNEQSLATKWLYSKVTTLLNKINITIYFKNLTIELHVLYALNVNRTLFTI